MDVRFGLRIPPCEDPAKLGEFAAAADMAHAVDWDHAVEVAAHWVDDEMGKRYADTFCLVGDGAYCAERIRGIVARGINSLYLRDFFSYTLPEDLLRTFGAEVIPQFRGASAGGHPLTS